MLESSDDHGQTHHDQRTDGDDLDQGEPEFGFAEGLHGAQVQHQQQGDAGQARDPQGQVAPPEGDVVRDGHDIRDAGDNPAEPVGPAGEEGGPGAEQVAGEVGEGLVVEVAQQQLAHGAHDEEEHEADDHVHEDDRGAGDGDGLAGAHEQAGADGAADCDELDMAIGESAFELGGRAG